MGFDGFLWERISYKNWIGVSNELFNPQALPELNCSELVFFQTCTFAAWKTRDWSVRMAIPWLEKALQNRMKRNWIVRCRGSLCKKGLLQLHRKERTGGNYYIVNPILLRTEERDQLAHWQDASWLYETYQIQAATKDTADCHLVAASPEIACLEAATKDTQRYRSYKVLEGDAATRLRCPDGQIVELLEKGVRPSADDVRAREAFAMVHAELDRIGARSVKSW